MTSSPLRPDDVRALCDSLDRLNEALNDPGENTLTGSAATIYRVEGACVALRAVLGDLPVEAVVARMQE